DVSLERNRERRVFLVQRIERRRADVTREINVRLIRVMEQAETASYRCLVIAEDIVSEPQSRVPVPDRWIRFECMRNVGVRSVRERIHYIVQIAVVLDGIGLVLITEPHINRELPSCLPVILNVWRERDVTKITIAVGLPVPGSCENPGRAGEECLKTIEGVVSVPIGIAERIDLLPAQADSEFQRMRTFRRD